MSVLWGAPGGGLLPAVEVPVGQTPVALLAADVLGDSRPELVVADAGSSDVRVLTYDAAIGLSLTQKIAVAGSPQQLVALPRPGGGVDLAALSATLPLGSVVGVVGGKLTRQADFATAGGATAAVAADIDGDGQPELLLAQPGRGQLAVLSRSGVGFVTGSALSVTGTPRGVAVADLNEN